ncbi:hypothetical protein ATY41_11020 [Leifsonia xyli subsp. xyli]|uniref:Uncharacterized protein n=1 Tax=Leifsonia xyli subsp. xyli TaxID=59736 RepID=A0A1E2SKC5_LEIXY|nr:hypothetical protein [Leifsonia xyli]ODA90213.1 hypothetical protein ATY41_11020 [Leifsonia xyli subsp. xyli]
MAFWALLVLINGLGLWLRFASHDVGPLDMRADFSPEYVQASLETYGESRSIDIYRFFFIPADFLFILSYARVSSCETIATQRRVSHLAPVGVGIADALENLTVLWMLNNGTSGWSFEALTVFMLVKDAGLVTYLGWLSVSWNPDHHCQIIREESAIPP